MKTRPLLLGHRGARGEKSIPENTLASFDLALASGCDGFEFDVQLTADRQAVVCHDAKTRNGVEIAESSAEELALPLLSEVLNRYRSTAFLDIELKVTRLEKITTDLLRDTALEKGYVVSSFLPEVLRSLYELESSVPLGLICETRAELGRWTELPVSYVILHHRLVRAKLVKEITDAGKQLLVWTVNTPSDMQRFAQCGLNGIISDHPERLVRALNVKS